MHTHADGLLTINAATTETHSRWEITQHEYVQLYPDLRHSQGITDLGCNESNDGLIGGSSSRARAFEACAREIQQSVV